MVPQEPFALEKKDLDLFINHQEMPHTISHKVLVYDCDRYIVFRKNDMGIQYLVKTSQNV